jgi:N-acyl-D-aspartate/D-glutamate deacylase
MNAWGRAGDAIALILQARKDGLEVTADQYPYIASSTSLTATVVPPQFREGSAKDLIERLDDAEQGPKLRAAIEKRLEGRGDRIRIASYNRRTDWHGKTIAQIADAEKKQPIDIALDILRNGGAQIVNFGMNEEEVRLYMKQPFVATASDGAAMVPSASVPHPRSYGTFPRKIGVYALKEGVISLEQAIRSSSGLPADILKLPERGYLKVGYYADIVIFDPQTFRDVATFDRPHQYSTGVRYLFVNGQAAIDAGKRTSVLAGRVLRHESKGG